MNCFVFVTFLVTVIWYSKARLGVTCSAGGSGVESTLMPPGWTLEALSHPFPSPRTDNSTLLIQLLKMSLFWIYFSILLNCFIFLYFIVFWRYHLGDYGGEILNEVKVNRSEKELYASPATLHNGNHHKVQECKTKVNILWRAS